MNLTIRNISDDVLNKIRTISKVEKRSLNSEILLVLERGIEEEMQHYYDDKKNISKNVQLNIWRRLSTEWQDDRSTDEIINDIYSGRTLGREFQL